METHELDIEIKTDGTVRVLVRGVKGPACEQYAKLFTSILPGPSTLERTGEYYEASTGVNINLGVRG